MWLVVENAFRKSRITSGPRHGKMIELHIFDATHRCSSIIGSFIVNFMNLDAIFVEIDGHNGGSCGWRLLCDT